MTSYDQIRERLRGPVYPILPAFNEDGSFDLTSVEGYVRYLNEHDVAALMVTAGTSRFNLLTDAEVLELNQAVAKANAGKTLVIAANPMQGTTHDAVRFAKQFEDMGADAILAYFPERYYNDDQVFSYFEAIARNTNIGVMIHANPMRAASGGNAQFSVELCNRLVQLDNFVGMKEEHGNEDHRYKLAVHLSDRMNFVVAGRAMRMFMGCFLFGIQAYLVGVGSFKPQIEESFYANLQNGEYDLALKSVHEIEEPFFDTAMPMGWHIAMKATLNLLGLMPITERPPLYPASESQLATLRSVITDLGWL